MVTLSADCCWLDILLCMLLSPANSKCRPGDFCARQPCSLILDEKGQHDRLPSMQASCWRPAQTTTQPRSGAWRRAPPCMT